MTLTRVSTYGIQQTTLSNALRLQNNLFDIQTQISSGFKASTFEGLNGQVEKFTALENKLDKSGKYVEDNKLVSSRLDTVNTVLGQLIDSSNAAKNLVLQRRNQTTAGSLAITAQID